MYLSKSCCDILFIDKKLSAYVSAGPLLKEILQHMEEIISNPQSRRAYFYSAHDITIVNTMRTMGFTSKLLKPDYGAMLILELHLADNGKQNVKVDRIIV